MLLGHGGDIFTLAAESGVKACEIYDFSSNTSPLSFPEGLKEHITAGLDEIAFLPEVDSASLRQALARRFSLLPENFIVCSGTTEWIYRLARISGAQKAIIPVPSYSDYVDAASLAGMETILTGPWPYGNSPPNKNLLDDLLERASTDSLIYLCNPNNPTGRFFQPSELKTAMIKSSQTLWIVDESYAPFIAPDHVSSLISPDWPENCIVLRSFSKIYGIPGLRLGYVAGGEKLLKKLSNHLLPWSAGRLAQIAGKYLLEQNEYEDKVRRFVKKEKKRFLEKIEHIEALGYSPGETHFMLFKVKPPNSLKIIAKKLRAQKILIRDCSNFEGIEQDYIRISLRLSDDNDILIEALENLL